MVHLSVIGYRNREPRHGPIRLAAASASPRKATDSGNGPRDDEFHRCRFDGLGCVLCKCGKEHVLLCVDLLSIYAPILISVSHPRSGQYHMESLLLWCKCKQCG